MKYSRNRLRIILFTVLLMSTSSALKAQQDLSILGIFDKYGKQSGVTMLEVSDELMKDYRIKIFKSIIFEDATHALPDIREAIAHDKKEAKKIKEATHDGLLKSGYYRLNTTDEKLNRYLIFKVGKNNKTTLIFIEGALTSEELVDLLR